MKIWLLLLALALVGCGTSAARAPEPVTITAAGADRLAPVVRNLAETFTRQTPNLTFEIEAANSNRALQRLVVGEISFALTVEFQPDLDEFRQTPIARDGLVLIVNPDNPVDNLTLLDLQRLYAGQVVNWQDVQGSTGPDRPVQVISREQDSVTKRLFEAQILAGKRLTPNARIFPNSKAIADFVSQYPEAIGYVGLANVTDQVKVVAVEEVLPTSDTVTSGAYPLTQLLYLVTPPDSPTIIQDFLKFAVGPAGQSIVAGSGLGRVN